MVGVDTSVPFHLRVMREPDFRAGRLDIRYLDEHEAELLGRARRRRRRSGSPRWRPRSWRRRRAPDRGVAAGPPPGAARGSRLGRPRELERPVSPSPGRGGRSRRRSRPQAPPRRRCAIESIAAGGEGVGRLADGRVVFVHRTAPGDRAEVAVTEQHAALGARPRCCASWSPRPERREPPCPFYARVRRLHPGAPRLRGAAPRQGAASSPTPSPASARIATDPPEVVPSPEEFRYRNRVSFALRRLRGGRRWSRASTPWATRTGS